MATPNKPVTILVVDDDPGIALLIARELRRDGHHTATACSGEEAVTWMNDHSADLVLLDLKLPGLQGNDLIDCLDSFHDHLPFIIITGQGDERVAVDMMKRGALDYLVKDVNFITMVPTVVRRALTRLEEQQRLVVAEQGLARSHADLERRVIERTRELSQSNEALRESRLQALKLMEDAVAARRKAEQAEAALRQSEERLRLFVEHSPAPVVMFDRDMRYLVVSRRWEQDFRLKVNDLIGRSHYEVFPEMPAHWKEIHQRCLAGATESCERDPFPRADGSIDWLKWEIRPWHDVKGGIGGIILFAEVINDRVRIENEVLTARRFAESTLEAVPASLAVLNAEGKILSTNQSWTKFAEANGACATVCGVGCNYLAVCDAAAGDGVEESARFAAGIRDVMSGTLQRFHMEYACHTSDQKRWFVGYVTPFTGNGPHSVVVAHVDVSERKRAEQVIRQLNVELEKRVEERTMALQQANEKLREEAAMRRRLEEEILHISEHEKQRIGQDLHDDLGQQLAGIWLLSDLLKASLADQGFPEAESAEKITNLLKNALELTRSLARGLHPVAMQAGGLIAALDELSTRTSDMFRIHCRCNCPPSLEMDNTTATHLYRIAQEAVTNAVKHGLATELDIELSTNPHSTVLSVKDQGQGIDGPDPKECGMGLRIMNYRADIIGGTLDIQRNHSGIGTSVICTIPTPKPATTPAHG